MGVFRPRPNTTMSIVVITIPDPVKQEFVRILQDQTDAVSLVVIQSRPPKAWYRTLADTLNPTHIYYSLLLRLRPAVRTALAWFRAIPSDPSLQDNWYAPVVWTDDINDSAIKARIAAAAPDVLAIWGSGLIDDEIIQTADHTLNLHLGVAPHYRGALANQFAVGRGDAERIGYTIHYVNGRADAGDIIAARAITPQSDPRTTFQTINQKARTHYIEIIARLCSGKPIERRQQSPATTGHASKMRDWTPRRRYQLGQRLLWWRRRGRFIRDPLPSFQNKP